MRSASSRRPFRIPSMWYPPRSRRWRALCEACLAGREDSAGPRSRRRTGVGVHDVVMPRLSDSMEEGTILRWLKAPGDAVERGEELVEIETDKANMVYEADAEGTLIELVAAEGDTLPIGEVIARVGEPGEKPSGDGAPAAEKAQPVKPEGDTEAPRPKTARPAPASGPTDGRVKASPLARRIAQENGVEIGAIAGSGPSGRIVKADVERAIASGPAPAAAPAAPPAP